MGYLQAWTDGDSVYRISGNKGTARFLNFTVQGPRPETQPGTDIPSLHEPFGDIPEANLFGHQMQTDADGNFELYVGGEARTSNWLPTTRSEEHTAELPSLMRTSYDVFCMKKKQ